MPDRTVITFLFKRKILCLREESKNELASWRKKKVERRSQFECETRELIMATDTAAGIPFA
jgi:hypothetical protein